MTPAWWYTYPSEKLWTSSVGMMTFPTNMENHKWSKRPNHQPGSMYIHAFCILFFRYEYMHIKFHLLIFTYIDIVPFDQAENVGPLPCGITAALVACEAATSHIPFGP